MSGGVLSLIGMMELNNEANSAFETNRTLDGILERHSADLGKAFLAYRNHAYRVASFCVLLSSKDGEATEKIAIAAAFHDMAIWTNKTFDYVAPSVQLAQDYLQRVGKSEWVPEISEMICAHHKLSKYRGASGPLVEPFRKADWIDVTCGFRKFGLTRRVVCQLYKKWPSAGFHRLLVSLQIRHVLTHPFNPMPMMRL